MALIETKLVAAGLGALIAVGGPTLAYLVNTEGRVSSLEADARSTKELIIETRDMVKELHGHMFSDAD